MAMQQMYPSPYHVPNPYNALGWYPDAAASHHMTQLPNVAVHSTPYQGTDQVIIDNGQGLSISSIGSTFVNSSLCPNDRLSLNNFLYVPQLTRNLVSVVKFALENNVFFFNSTLLNAMLNARSLREFFMKALLELMVYTDSMTSALFLLIQLPLLPLFLHFLLLLVL